ncbi:MAG: hybrid sensor histidine kinase/response regulator [Cyanobacteria bacterium P01_A01_bin.114]
MAQDLERQAQLSCLDEIAEYFDTIESVLLELTEVGLASQQIDATLRAAHTIKGLGAMIGCQPLGSLAHRLEDYLKILKARQHTIDIDSELQTWLLLVSDRMRQIADLYRQDWLVDDAWMASQVDPVLAQLHARLGELQESDEAALLAQEEKTDIVAIMFESEVEGLLQRLEGVLDDPALPCLREELDMIAQEFGDLGQMLELGAFVELCGSVRNHLAVAASEGVEAIARQAVKDWRQTQALVMMGKATNLPRHFEVATGPLVLDAPVEADFVANGAGVAEELTHLTDLPEEQPAEFTESAEVDLQEFFNSLELSEHELSELQEAIASFETVPSSMLTPGHTESSEISTPEILTPEIAESEARNPEVPTSEAFAPEVIPPLTPETLTPETLTPETLTPETLVSETLAPQPITQATRPIEIAPPGREAKPVSIVTPTPQADTPESMVRVPVRVLAHLNDLFGELIIQRNTLNSRIGQLNEFVNRVYRYTGTLERINGEFQTLSNRAAAREVLPELLFGTRTRLRPPVSAPASAPVSPPVIGPSALQSNGAARYQRMFDSMEMDRYSDLRLLSQEHGETVVRLKEATGDMKFSLQEIKQATGDLNRTAKELQVSVTRARMRPLSDVVKQFPRLVRDLSVQYGKQVDFQVHGSGTLIDRYILENLRDPLMHLLHNAFGHGIELPEDRQAVGKSPQGRIEIWATHRGNQTLISIQDDGAGINLGKVRERALKMGIDQALLDEIDEAELLGLIFEPGFSTATQVTDLSGRGVGMDVVRTNLAEVRGDIKVNTRPGEGTTFTISVPFTLSTIRALLIEVGSIRLAFPTDGIQEVVRLKSHQIHSAPGQDTLNWEGLSVPLIRLDRWLSFNCPRRVAYSSAQAVITEPIALIVRQEGELKAIYVDRFWGEREIVIRQVENVIGLPPGFIGSTILEDGQALPLADALKLLDWITLRSAGDLPSLSSSVNEAAPSSPDNGASILSPAPIGQSEPLSVLVVDDSINARRFLAKTLEKGGYRVEQAKDGQEAVEKLLQGLPVQAVLCDIEMPRLDGYDFLAEIKPNPKFKALPVIMLTSRSGDKHRQLALRLGASAYFTKPYQDHELLDALEQLVHSSVKSF